MKLVVIESPLKAETPELYEHNRKYARACMADCLKRGEAPFASHLLYDQPGILDDAVPAERMLGIKAGLAWGAQAEARVFYVDLGFSDGMKLGAEAADALRQTVVTRTLGAPWSAMAPSESTTTTRRYA